MVVMLAVAAAASVGLMDYKVFDEGFAQVFDFVLTFDVTRLLIKSN